MILGLVVVVLAVLGAAAFATVSAEASPDRIDPGDRTAVLETGPGTDPPLEDTDEPGDNRTDANASDTAGSTAGTTTERASDGQKAVIWRGFRHAWGYNHRFNRFGSWVEMKDCDDDVCRYEVGHSGASGSGKDRAVFRDAYTELSAKGVEFEAGEGSIDFDVPENDIDPIGLTDIDTFSRTVEVDLDSAGMEGMDNYVAVLNGFDYYSQGEAAKMLVFDVRTTQVTIEDGDAVFDVRFRVLMDCDSVECKGPGGAERGGKGRQTVDYKLEYDWLLIAGEGDALRVTRPDHVGESYTWDNCKNNKVNVFWKDEPRNDKWPNVNMFPGNRMFCEGSEGRELDYRNRINRRTISGDVSGDYSVATVGIKSLEVELDREAHFTQYDNVVGGNYDPSGGYDLKAIPFFKEWASRPGQFEDAKFSYGFEGGAAVATTPVLIQIKDGCKRSFVTAGGLEWGGGGERPTSDEAAKTEDYAFEYGDHWTGYSGRGNECEYDREPRVPYDSVSNDPAFWVTDYGGKSVWREFQSTENAEDPTKLRGKASDRYYSKAQKNKPKDRPEIKRIEVVKTVDKDGDGKISELWIDFNADARYPDPSYIGGQPQGGRGDPVLDLEMSTLGSDDYTLAVRNDLLARDYPSGIGIFRIEFGEDLPVPSSGRYDSIRAIMREKPNLMEVASATVRLSPPRRVESAEDDQKATVRITAEPNGFLYIDGEYVGGTPWEGQVPPEVGEKGPYTVEVRRGGWKNATRTVDLDPPQTITFDLEKRYVPLVVNTSPPGATVFINDTHEPAERIGTTPLSEDVWAGDTFDVEIRKEGYINLTFEDVSAPRTINTSLPLIVEDYVRCYVCELPTDLNLSGTDSNETEYDNDSDSVVVDVPDVDDGVIGSEVVGSNIVDYLPEIRSLVVAEFDAAPRKPKVWREVTFDARESYALTGSIDTYRWSFDDGTTATGAVVNHTFDTAGTYAVTLTATMNGTSNSTTRTIEVVDRPPVAAFSVENPPVERGELAQFDASAARDPEGNISVIHWRMGDGVRWTGEHVNHTYTSTGNFTVTVRVVDENGNEDVVRRTIRVREPNDPPRPSFSIAPRNPTVGEGVTFDASGSGDPDGRIQSYYWRIGTGAIANGSTLTYAFPRTGTYNVTLEVVDDRGATRRVRKTVEVKAEKTPTPTATETPTPTTTRTPTRTPRPTETATATTTADPAETTATTVDGPDETTTGDEEGSTTSEDGGFGLPMPGFGIVSVLVALVIAAMIAWRRR